MEITDKERLDFMERWLFQKKYESVVIAFGESYTESENIWLSLEIDYSEKEITGVSIRNCIDKAIIAMQEEKDAI